MTSGPVVQRSMVGPGRYNPKAIHTMTSANFMELYNGNNCACNGRRAIKQTTFNASFIDDMTLYFT